ncbi:MAG: molybdate ABC transporter substrate-binding protein [Chloroflexota bacterium]
MRYRRLLSILLVALLVAACSGSSAASPSAGASAAASSAASAGTGTELQVYAAASLKASLAQVVKAYGAIHPDVKITVSTDSSTALLTKIQQGAPADVFLSADTKNPQALVDGGQASGSVVKFAGNLLTVIVPTANPAGITAPADLAKSGVKIIACAEGVPIQKYTAQWLDKVKALPAYGADFGTRVLANVVSKEDNVGAIVTKVGLGEGDAGIVYVTDAKTSDKVKTIEIPAAENVPATYGGVVVKASKNQEMATAFLAWLAGADGQKILASFGFLPPAN